ncbi:hypothetical protein ACTXT7_005680 [Hymenolepis weldensis]
MKIRRITTKFYEQGGILNVETKTVIFSQSTETLDRQLSMHSSSETTSINDASNPVCTHVVPRASKCSDIDWRGC